MHVHDGRFSPWSFSAWSGVVPAIVNCIPSLGRANFNNRRPVQKPSFDDGRPAMSRLITSSLLLLTLFLTPGLHALDQAEVHKSLARSVTGPAWSLDEVQRFVEQRTARMPAIESREQWERTAASLRANVLENVVFRGEAATWRAEKTKVEWLDDLQTGEGYRIRKLRYQAVPGMWIPALLYEPMKLDGKAPVVLNVNGHDRNGKAADYKQMRCINQAKRGMIALNVEWLHMGQLRMPGNEHYAMNQLDLCGTSGLAPFFLSMSRGLDVLLAHKHADPQRVAVAGLSGGGWQTIFISSLDTRVTLANPVAGYSSFLTRTRHFKDLGDSEQTPNDLAFYADYTHLTAMLAPRAALLTYNQADNCCFEAPYALPPLLKAAEPVYKLFGKPKSLRTHINVDPGNHNFEKDNREALYGMFRDHFFGGAEAYAKNEIESAKELKSKSELAVPLPDDNTTFNRLALKLSQTLPRDAAIPSRRADVKSWQQNRRKTLNEILHSGRDKYEVAAGQQDSMTHEGVRVTYWRLKIGDWTVPATEFVPPSAAKSVIIFGDDGRKNLAAQVHQLVDTGHRVLAIDPFYFGESKISQKDFLFGLLVASVGRRPLGIQANQVAATARWMRKQSEGRPVTVQATGHRSSLIGLIAAGIEPDSIQAVDLRDSLGSLKEIIERNQTVNQTPEMFCFGLLEQFDILQLSALVAPRKIAFSEPSQRLQKELKSLPEFYELLGTPHDPFSVAR